MNTSVNLRVGPDTWPARNHLLSRIAASDRETLGAKIEPVELIVDQLLYARGDPLTHIYFPTSGMISMVVVMEDGRTTEAATVGREGAAGISASGYVDPAFTNYTVQIPGTACRMTAADFEDMVDASVPFCSAVARWRDVLLRMTVQSVACNALHNVRQRCARWILMTHDRAEDGLLTITQEFLGEMLGVKRNAVSIVARELQQLGAIDYKRGRVTVLDPARLHAISCECYPLLAGEIAKLLDATPSTECDD